MNLKPLLFCLCYFGAVPTLDAQTFTSLPADLQLYPRDVATNTAVATIAGETTDEGIEALGARIYIDGLFSDSIGQDLTYEDGRASFSLNVPLTAGLISHRIEVVTRTPEGLTVVHEADDIVAGDVFLVNGQSNAEARQYHGDANVNQSLWIRSFGTSSPDPDDVTDDMNWYVADGNAAASSGAIGQWPIRMARLIVDAHNVPVAILNGSLGGQAILWFRRNSTNPDDPSSNYGRLLYRAQHAGVADDVRAIFWYQGEADGLTEENTEPDLYALRFEFMYDGWLEDYPSVEQVYVFQVRGGCGTPSPALRDTQRRFADEYEKVRVMSTTGVDGHDDCHFSYRPGYEDIGLNIYRVMSRDLYHYGETDNIDPPNVDRVYFSNEGRTEITVRTRAESDRLVWDNGAENDFSVSSPGVRVTSGQTRQNKIILSLSAPAPETARLTYADTRAITHEWVTNVNGVGLLNFDAIPVEPYVVGSETTDPLLPTAFSLDPGFPNPFHTSTVLSFTLPTSEQVSLTIYDVHGRAVETLASGRYTAGSHRVTWHARDVANGVYVCRMQAGAFVQARPLVLHR